MNQIRKYFAFGLLAAAAVPLVVYAQQSVTLTIAGPNQWNASSTSFGDAWEAMVKQFETLNPGVKVQTTVLPIPQFYQTLSTQLQAGSAANLIFNQANYKSSQVVSLNKYLLEPNPYAPEFKRWIDVFDPNGFGEEQQDVNGNWNWVPFNLFSKGLFVNEDALAKAGVKLPLNTWQDLRAALPKLKAAGYTPFGMDNSDLGLIWTFITINDMLQDRYFTRLNVFKSNGDAGKSKQLNIKAYTRAVKTGLNPASRPEMAETLKLLKEVYDNATPNWSGVKGTSGAGVNLKDFTAGKVAMTWGVNFGIGELQDAKPNFKVGSIGLPTITRATTPLAQNVPARSGVAPGGTSYMIPANTKSPNLETAVKFLQYITSPKYNQPWLTESAGASAIKGVKAIDAINGFGSGAWAQTPRMNSNALPDFSPQARKEFTQIMQGYLLGTSNLADTQKSLAAAWERAADYQLTQNPAWKNEAWAK